MFREKYPRITFTVGGNIEQVTILFNATLEDFMAAFGLGGKEDTRGIE